MILTFYTCGVNAQKLNEKYGSWIKTNGYSLEISFHNDTLARFSYNSYNGGSSIPVKYIQTEDSLFFFNPLPQEQSETMIEYDSIKTDTICISVSAYSYYDNGTGMSIYNVISKDQVHFDTLKPYEIFALGELEKIPDSILVNSEWIQLEKEKISSTIYIDQYTYYPPSNSDIYGFPEFFDTLVLIRNSDFWQVQESKELNQFDLSLFQEIRPVTWQWSKDDIVVYENVNHDFIPSNSIRRLIVDSIPSGQLDLSKYVNLQHLTVNHSPEHLTIKSSFLTSLNVNCDSSVSKLDLQLSQSKIESLLTSVPLKNSNIKSVGYLTCNISSEEEQDILNSYPVNTSHLCLNYQKNNVKIQISENWKSVNYLFLSKDTIDLNCDFSMLRQIDTLVLYGHANQFSFLDCQHNLKYLGIFYSNESQSNAIKATHPELDQQIWCFPIYTNVCLVSGKNIGIEKLIIGDTIMSVDKYQNKVPSRINCIEYHFDVDTTLFNLNSNILLASSEEIPIYNYSTYFTKEHPLYVNDSPICVELIETDQDLLTLTGLISYYYFELREEPFNGTLINIRTDAGNFFINGICFMNK
ncbi:MAG: hypothetical protein HUJ25_05725 [Crocinitomicaceae bacterium]|nr:hypothetical protein [Crocinitomicaceae bacterium]